MFVILYRGTMDDVVIRVTPDGADAEKQAKLLADYYDAWEASGRPHHPQVELALGVYRIDVGTYCNISILETDSVGQPKNLTVLE